MVINSKVNKYVSWQPEYSVGNEEIDNQHKKLFMMINELQNSIEHNATNDKQPVEKVLEELISYAEYHFSTEENLFRGQAGFDTHHHEHWTFIKKSFSFVKRFNADNDLKIITDIVIFLRSWLIDHILVTDIKQFRDLNTVNS